MKMICLLIAVAGFFGLINFSAQKAATDKLPLSETVKQSNQTPPKNKTPVLVELFTSEGCATCPPADRNLAVLDKEQPSADAEIITLALHVDYWNRQGWIDEFSSPLYSQRQEIYGTKFKIISVYTPQMVVDGSRHFVGSNLAEAQKAIDEAAKAPKANIELAFSEDKLKVKVSDMPKHENAAVFLAIAENNLKTEVKRGENDGKVLEHTSVVRELKPIGRILAPENNFQIETVLQLQPKWKKQDLKTVVFVQENQSRRILGVKVLKIF